MRENIFISYSHHDQDWCTRFEQALSLGVNMEVLDVWSDMKIGTGDRWNNLIEDAIARARVALLLVTPDFFESKFIITKELRTILDRHESGGLQIWWVPIRKTTEEKQTLAGLRPMQAAWKPAEPLADLNKKEQRNVIEQICSRLIKDLGLVGDIPRKARDEFFDDVASAVGVEIVMEKEPINMGDFSITYKGRYQDKEEVAIKAIIPSARRRWLAADFIARAQLSRRLLKPSFIRIHDIITRKMNCVIREFVAAPTLEEQLASSDKDGMPAEKVTNILSQLADAAAELHKLHGSSDENAEPAPLLLGPLQPKHIYVDMQERARISPIHISYETIRSCHLRPTFLLDDEMFTYLTPERYAGKRSQPASDQYYLGLLGLELLHGRPPVLVETLADLENKKHFFLDPRSYFGDLPVKAPALSFVLTKMLEYETEDRWTDMNEVSTVLGQIMAGDIPHSIRKYAASTYNTKLRGNHVFLDVFYRILFESAEDIRFIFERRGTTMDEQYRKLDSALGDLLSFQPGLVPNVLSARVSSHREYGLDRKHFDDFREAFLKAFEALPTGFDNYALDAWRVMLDAGLNYMAAEMEATPAKVTNGAVS